MNKKLLAVAIVIGLAGCNSSNSDNDSQDREGFDLRILHINDHHSKLDATEEVSMTLGGIKTKVDVGGYPRLVTKFNELQNSNTLRLHAGDAITGTMYYSLFREELPDALMMNQVCFDAFALGNHEFDDGNEQLAHFINTLKNGEDACGTEVLAANIEVPSTNPIYGIYDPYKVFDVAGHQIGVIGIDISSKTEASSSPSEDTVFLDEVETAQRYIDKLKEDGVEKIVLLTHYTYENDIAMAKQLTGVDVIVGGDSHSLLGDQNVFNTIGYGSVSGDYPTVVQNAEGNDVCVVQAWDNSKVLGELNVKFDSEGNIAACSGTPHLLLADNFFEGYLEYDEIQVDENGDPIYDEEGNVVTESVKEKVHHSYDEYEAIREYVHSIPSLSIVEDDVIASEKLSVYSDEIEEKKKDVIGNSLNNLCNDRVPGQGHGSGDICGSGTPEREFMDQYGSVMGHIVSKAFLELSLQSDIAIQNTGGVRNSIPEGDVTVGHAFDVLPFTNLLVNLTMTGQEIVDTLEDAIDNVVENNSTGAFPTAANLKFKVDMNAAKGNRVTEVEARRKGDDVYSEWHAIELSETYVVVTNDFIANGGDRYDSMKPVFEDPDRSEETGLLYTDSLIKYIDELDGTPLEQPLADDMPIKSFIPKS
ncbi:5'-nucleotidase [Vibrio sp. JCM 19236]|nr:5'-nucleotidase [Vibrio sp. JCM 19236]